MNKLLESWDKLGSSVNNAFYFVVDKIITLQGFFLGEALKIGRVVLLIAILSTALNYALTGTGLKENIIKILKATVFFFIVVFAYPNIVGFITSWTFNMAEGALYPSIQKSFTRTTAKVLNYVDYSSTGGRTHINKTINQISDVIDRERIFGSGGDSNIVVTRNPLVERPNGTSYTMSYKTVAPAALLRVIFLLATECFEFSDKANFLTNAANVLNGIICGFFIILTGVFALLEYCVCFLEFMLVASVGIILFPLSIWEGSKFMAEKFIGALLGFFMKLLFCNLAIFLLLYGFISLLYIMSDAGFQGSADQILFIIFVCLLFFYICKSAPGIAQSLLTGTPSLSASGAVSAVGGAVAAAAGAGQNLQKGAQKLQDGGRNFAGSMIRAGAAASETALQGGGKGLQAKAFFKSIGKDVSDSAGARALGLTRNNSGSNTGGSTSAHSALDTFKESNKAEGKDRHL